MDSTNQIRVTAEHECAHALAYIDRGYVFESVDVPHAMVRTPGLSIRASDLAAVCLTGPMVDLRYHIERERSAAAGIRSLLESWTEVTDYLSDEPDDDDAAAHDIFGARGYLAGTVPGAWAFVSANWSLIQELAASIGDNAVTYSELVARLGDRGLAVGDFVAGYQMWEPFLQHLEDLDARIGRALDERERWKR